MARNLRHWAAMRLSGIRSIWLLTLVNIAAWKPRFEASILMPSTTSIVQKTLRNFKIIVKMFLTMLIGSVAVSTVETTDFKSENGNVFLAMFNMKLAHIARKDAWLDFAWVLSLCICSSYVSRPLRVAMTNVLPLLQKIFPHLSHILRFHLYVFRGSTTKIIFFFYFRLHQNLFFLHH